MKQRDATKSLVALRLPRFMKNTVIRSLVTVLAVAAQFFGYHLAMLVAPIYIHLWAGGNL